MRRWVPLEQKSREKHNLKRRTATKKAIEPTKGLARRFVTFQFDAHCEAVRVVKIYLKLKAAIGAGRGFVVPFRGGAMAGL